MLSVLPFEAGNNHVLMTRQERKVPLSQLEALLAGFVPTAHGDEREQHSPQFGSIFPTENKHVPHQGTVEFRPGSGGLVRRLPFENDARQLFAQGLAKGSDAGLLQPHESVSAPIDLRRTALENAVIHLEKRPLGATPLEQLVASSDILIQQEAKSPDPEVASLNQEAEQSESNEPTRTTDSAGKSKNEDVLAPELKVQIDNMMGRVRSLLIGHNGYTRSDKGTLNIEDDVYSDKDIGGFIRKATWAERNLQGKGEYVLEEAGIRSPGGYIERPGMMDKKVGSLAQGREVLVVGLKPHSGGFEKNKDTYIARAKENEVPVVVFDMYTEPGTWIIFPDGTVKKYQG